MSWVPKFETGAKQWPLVFGRLRFGFMISIVTLFGHNFGTAGWIHLTKFLQRKKCKTPCPGRSGETPADYLCEAPPPFVPEQLLVVDQQSFESVLYWLAGSVAGRDLDLVLPLLPLFGGAIVLSALLVRHANALLLGDDMVTSLGMRAGSIKLLLGLVVIVLAGSSVALAGMIGFVGLIVPHMARRLFGIDHRWMLPGCAVLGACLLLLADTASRFLIPPQEVPVGVMTALIGTPFFIYLARRNMARQ